MDRRFHCQGCGAKWFIHEHQADSLDLTSCDRCGGPLVRFVDAPGDDESGSQRGEGTGELGEDR